MRGGRTEPRMVSRTAYNAHAAARHAVSSYAEFIGAQQDPGPAIGIPVIQTPAIVPTSGLAPQRRPRSLSPNNRQKRLRGQPPDTTDSDKSDDSAEEGQEFTVKQEESDGGFQEVFFGSGRGDESPKDNSETERVRRTNTMILYCNRT
jgi:hypothetical protein